MDKLDAYQILPPDAENERATTTISVKKEIYEDADMSHLNCSYDDVSRVKREDLQGDHQAVRDTVDNYMKIDITHELYNNLVRAYNTENSSIEEAEDFNTDQKDNDVEVSTTEGRYKNRHTIKQQSNKASISSLPMKEHQEKQAFCDVCEKTFNSAASLVLHRRTHTGEKPYVCIDCNKGFASLSVLQVHKRTHTGHKPYVCGVCSKAFSDYSSMYRHKNIHSGEKKFKCNVCNKAFNCSTNMARHKRTHTGEKPYACDECDKTCTTSSQLVKHVRTHTGERPYVCVQCGNLYTTSSHLARHKRTHR